jgi:K+-sensing histidine kinase KdpD
VCSIIIRSIFRKVGTNLIENAIRHGGLINRNEFSCPEFKDSLIIICEENGKGIPFEEKEKIVDHGYGDNIGIMLFMANQIHSITGLSIRECGEPWKGVRFELFPKEKYRISRGLKI